MRKPWKQLYSLYRYQPVKPQQEVRKKIPDPEVEQERFYGLIHIKLSPQQLRRLSSLNILFLTGIIIALFLGALFLPKPTKSEIEKRDLAKKPSFSFESLLSVNLSHEIELYFSDTFPFREWFVSLSAVINESKGIRVDDVRVVAPSNDTDMIAAEPITPDPMGSPQQGNEEQQLALSNLDQTQQTSPVDENAEGIVSNGTFICQGRAMSLYGGSHESARRYASVLNQYANLLPDVQIYNMIVPTAVEFYLPQKYQSMNQSQKEVIDLIYGSLNPSIKKVDAYDALAAHTNEYLYFRTDHHWTGQGAYYAYTAFCKQAGFSPLSMDQFETRRLDNFIGTLYAQTPDRTLLQEPDYVDYYIFDQPYTAVRYDRGNPYKPVPHNLWGEYAKSPNSYSVFLQGDFPLIEVDTGIHNGRKILVVKESYGNAFAPFLINHYEKVYIVDERYFERPLLDFIHKEGIHELLFANNAFAVCTPYQISCIENLKNAYVMYTPPVQKIPEVLPQESLASEPETPADTTAEQFSEGKLQSEEPSPTQETLPKKRRERPGSSGLLKPKSGSLK